MGNILTAIRAIIENSGFTSSETSQSGIRNRANQMGEVLEKYIRNAFADGINYHD